MYTYLINRNKEFKLIHWFILIGFLAIGVYLRIKSFQSVHIGIQEWLTRDMDRALNIIEGKYIPLAGPESNAGGRLPGPLGHMNQFSFLI